MSVELLNIDCMAYMATLPDKSFDLAIVDPPYGNESDAMHTVSSERVKLAKRNIYKKFKNIIPDENYFNELKRVSKHQIIWGGNFFGLKGGVIAWNKFGTAFGEGEIAICSTHKSVRFFEYTWNGMLQGDMKNKELRIHQTQKPVKLYDWLLHNYAKPGQRILDTHLGSGSSAIAAHYFGCDFVGCELDEDYYHASVNRFNHATAQVSLFDEMA